MLYFNFFSSETETSQEPVTTVGYSETRIPIYRPEHCCNNMYTLTLHCRRTRTITIYTRSATPSTGYLFLYPVSHGRRRETVSRNRAALMNYNYNIFVTCTRVFANGV